MHTAQCCVVAARADVELRALGLLLLERQNQSVQQTPDLRLNALLGKVKREAREGRSVRVAPSGAIFSKREECQM